MMMKVSSTLAIALQLALLLSLNGGANGVAHPLPLQSRSMTTCSFLSGHECDDDDDDEYAADRDPAVSYSSKTSPTTTTTMSSLLLTTRGGAVLAPETLPDVDAILVRAGSEGKLVVIDFSATWCGPCKQIAPLFEEMSEAMPDVVFIKIDVDENPDTAAKYNVSAMPTFVFIKGGEVVDRLMGANAARLQELIDEHSQ